MSSIRVYVVLLVMLVQFHTIHSKPFFFDLICDIICEFDDDDVPTSTTSSSEELCDCGPTTPSNRRGQQFGPSALNMRLPPSNGMNLSMNNTNGVWTFNLDALQPGQNGFGFVTPSPGASSSQAQTVVPGGSTAAGTTVAPTTAKK